MKFAIVETESVVRYKYLVALDDEATGEDAADAVLCGHLEDMLQEHGDEEIIDIQAVSDEDLEVAVEGSHMEGWSVRTIKETHCIASKQ